MQIEGILFLKDKAVSCRRDAPQPTLSKLCHTDVFLAAACLLAPQLLTTKPQQQLREPVTLQKYDSKFLTLPQLCQKGQSSMWRQFNWLSVVCSHSTTQDFLVFFLSMLYIIYLRQTKHMAVCVEPDRYRIFFRPMPIPIFGVEKIWISIYQLILCIYTLYIKKEIARIPQILNT